MSKRITEPYRKPQVKKALACLNCGTQAKPKHMPSQAPCNTQLSIHLIDASHQLNLKIFKPYTTLLAWLPAGPMHQPNAILHHKSSTKPNMVWGRNSQASTPDRADDGNTRPGLQQVT
jgi:hypothetical protein